MAKKKCLTSPIFLFICSLILLLCTGNAQKDTIKPGEALTYLDQLVSADGRFILGFFVPSNSDNVYLGIWYSNDDYDAKVWVANRNSPVYGGSSTNLTMDADGILRIMHGGGSSIPANPNQAAPRSLATLENSGNFVIRELNTAGSPKQVLWESFDHPTDTLLPGMKLGAKLQTGLNWTLTSWLSETLAAPGTFTLEWSSSDNGTGQLVMRRRGIVYWNSGNMNNYSFDNVPWLMDLSPDYRVYSFSNVSNENESYFNYVVNDGSISWWRLGSDGSLSDSNKPILVLPGSCDGFTSIPGCVAQKQPECRHKNNRFEPNNGHFVVKPYRLNQSLSIGLSDCWADCWNDCSCVAYGSIAINDTGCVFHSSELDFKTNVDEGRFYILKKSETGSKWWIWIIIAVVAVSAILLLGSLYYLRKKKLQRDRERSEEDMLFEITPSNRFSDEEGIGNEGQKSHDLKVFSFASIMDATNHFSPENKLGQGGFGPVYKGKLPEGKEIAVKRLSRSSGQGLVEFKNELILIAKLQHTNLVRLLGFCVKGVEKMLIYEYMPNKSLDFFLFDPTKREMLDWPRRNHIIEGIAQGLLYLHKYSRVKIIHRDLKASNILLDDDMNPKISDFGMASIFGPKKTEANTERIVGTYGYMSPEYAMEGIFSEKSDVYSFGVLMLEIVSGQKNSGFFYNDGPISLVVYAWELWKQGKSFEMIDSALGDSYSRSQVLRYIHVGLLCVQENAADRPTMSDVISALANEASPLPLPIPKQSAFSGQQKIMVDLLERVEEGCSVGVTVSEIQGR